MNVQISNLFAFIFYKKKYLEFIKVIMHDKVDKCWGVFIISLIFFMG